MSMKLWIAIPGYDGKAVMPFKDSLEGSAKLFEDNGIELVNVDILTGCCYLTIARNKLIMNFLRGKDSYGVERGFADTFMFLDADISWRPRDMIEFLKQDEDVVAGVYRYKLAHTEGYPCYIHVDENYRPKTKGPLIQASGVPTGFMKIKRQVFDTYLKHYGESIEIDEPDKNSQPVLSWYNFFDTEQVGRQWIGEDYNFCRKWTAMGGTLWVYPDITFAHYDYNYPHYGNFKEFLMKQVGGSKASPVLDSYQDNGIDGWMTPVELDYLYKESSKHESVVEIGSYKGRSTHALLSGLAKKITCIDPWRFVIYDDAIKQNREIGDEEHEEFCRNVAPLSDGNGRLRVIRDYSTAAVGEVESADMVFIDGDHAYEAVKADIMAWLPKTKKIICGHDYNPMAHFGVVKAVDEIFGDKVNLIDTIWYVEL